MSDITPPEGVPEPSGQTPPPPPPTPPAPPPPPPPPAAAAPPPPPAYAGAPYQGAPTAMVSFGDAVRRGFERITDFSGRATRAEFWWWYLFTGICYFVVYIVIGAVGRGSALFALLLTALWVVFFLATLAVGVRRLHDTDKTGWLILLGLIPCVGLILIVFWVMESNPGPNQYGAPSGP
jgi:uncharacterized membrane protein YhaH (DUF805 family)